MTTALDGEVLCMEGDGISPVQMTGNTDEDN